MLNFFATQRKGKNWQEIRSTIYEVRCRIFLTFIELLISETCNLTKTIFARYD